jgi:hypothetical protein
VNNTCQPQCGSPVPILCKLVASQHRLGCQHSAPWIVFSLLVLSSLEKLRKQGGEKPGINVDRIDNDPPRDVNVRNSSGLLHTATCLVKDWTHVQKNSPKLCQWTRREKHPEQEEVRIHHATCLPVVSNPDDTDFETSAEVRVADSFEKMNLKEDLLRGIYHYGLCPLRLCVLIVQASKHPRPSNKELSYLSARGGT